MKFRPAPRFWLAFVALLFVMHESHEIAHTTVARLICGCWGPRDFNVWSTCEGCAVLHPSEIVATFIGPLFTFALIWIGYAWLAPGRSRGQQSAGFALIFANMPFARILTAAMGGGDEVFGLTQVLGNHPLAWGLGLGFILAMCALPLVRAYRALAPRRRVLVFVGFLLLPLVVDLVVVLGVLNSLLTREILATPGVLGSPIIVNLWTVLVGVTLLLTYPALQRGFGDEIPAETLKS